MEEEIPTIKKSFQLFLKNRITASRMSLMVYKLSTPGPPKIVITVMNGVEFKIDCAATFLF